MNSNRVVVSNSGPLIVLGKLNRLELLAGLYEQVQIPQAVYTEVVLQGLAHGAPEAQTVRLFWQRRKWPVVEVDPDAAEAFHPSVVLDLGEMQVLALAQSLTDPLVLLDDELARDEARRLKLRLRGTLGVLTAAYRGGHLSYSEIDLLLQEIAVRPDIWISAKLCEQVLSSLGVP